MVLQLGTEEEFLLAFAAGVRPHSDAMFQHVQLYRTRLTEGGAAYGARHVAVVEGVLNEMTLKLGWRLTQRVT